MIYRTPSAMEFTLINGEKATVRAEAIIQIDDGMLRVNNVAIGRVVSVLPRGLDPHDQPKIASIDDKLEWPRKLGDYGKMESYVKIGEVHDEEIFEMKNHDGHAGINGLVKVFDVYPDHGSRFVDLNDGDGWESVWFTVEGDNLCVHVPGYQHDTSDPKATTGWMPHTVRFGLIAYMHADQMTDEPGCGEAEHDRYQFYSDALDEFKYRRRKKIDIGKPRDPEVHVTGCTATQVALYTAPHLRPYQYDAMRYAAGESAWGKEVNDSWRRIYGMDFASAERRIIGCTVDDGVMTVDFETHDIYAAMANAVQETLDKCVHEALLGKADLTNAATTHADDGEWVYPDPYHDRYLINSRSQGKSAMVRASLMNTLATAPGPTITMIAYGSTGLDNFGFELNKEITLPNGRVVCLHQVDRESKPNYYDDGFKRTAYPGMTQTKLTFHILQDKSKEACKPKFWYSAEKSFNGFPGTPDRTFISASRQRNVGSVTGRWSSEDAKRQALFAGYGGKPMRHDDYTIRLGGIEIAPENLELQLTSRIMTSKPGLPEEFTLRTAITSFFDGLASALTGKPVERLIPESNRDGGYDPKKIDFAAITAAMSGKSK